MTEIVSAVYCEQKAVFNDVHGEARTAKVARQAASGSFQHLRFELEGYTRNPAQLLTKISAAKSVGRDKRCFIASQVYGDDAPQTDSLRAWRDRSLMPSMAGRALVHLYYATSPALAAALRRSALATRVVRALLDRVVTRVGGQ